MDQIAIGKFISECRKEKHLTQAQLAERLGVTDRAVSKWETGRSMPDVSIMLELCEQIDISVNDLLNARRINMENYKEIAERTLFEASASEALGNGQAVELTRERIRGCIILLFALVSLCIYWMTRWVRSLKRTCRTWYDRTREDLKTHYPRQILGRLLLRCLGAVLLWGMLIGAAALLVMGAARLMMVFPEWVPEELVSASAIGKRFWDLTGMAASPVRFQTPEMAEIRFWSGLIRWGTVSFLIGAWLGGKRAADRRRWEAEQAEAPQKTDAQEA